MIDELIPDLQSPGLRALYDALLGRRKPTDQEISVIIAVGGRIKDATDILGPELTAQVDTVMERAWAIDEEGMKERLMSYIDTVNRESP